jgi:protocatechuate 3,4-dioxygenase beta subunit
VLGPFHTHDAPELPHGATMTSDPAGEPMLAVCTVHDTQGRPVPGVKVDIWETDSTGHYDVQHADRQAPSERCIMVTDDQGRFWFRGIRPVSYPIPNDGPVGRLLERLNRHCWRPAHVHFMFEKEGWDHLVTSVLSPRSSQIGEVRFLKANSCERFPGPYTSGATRTRRLTPCLVSSRA